MFATLVVWVALAFLNRRVPAPALRGGTGHPHRQQSRRRAGDQPGVVPGRQAGQPGHDQPNPPCGRPPGAVAHTVPPGPATPANFEDPVQYLIQHGYTQLTIYQPASQVLAVSVDRRWLAARTLAAPDGRDRAARPPPRYVNSDRRWLRADSVPNPTTSLGTSSRRAFQTDCYLPFRFRATASRIRRFSAASSILSSSLMSIARLTLPSRLELNRPEGSFNAAPLKNVSLTTFL